LRIRERAEAWRRDQAWTDLGGEEGIGAEEIGDQLIERDGRT